jgi:polyisoprenoid-binding protein YceI
MKVLSKGAALAAVAALALGLSAMRAPAADSYSLDTAHSAIVFNISHSDLSNVYGMFKSFSGSFSLDPSAPEKSSVELSIDVASIDTGQPKRDEHLNSPDFFNSAQYPVITFSSTSIKKVSDATYKVTGDLSMHGVTKSITIDVIHNGDGTGRNGEPRSGFSADFTIKRSDFGINYGLPNVGDDVHINASFQGMGEAPAAAEAPAG